jgi:LuxR family transcriptional regulator, maltose regulon positive regulatory protein
MSAMAVQLDRGFLELGRGRGADALAACRAAERLAGPHPVARLAQTFVLRALVYPAPGLLERQARQGTAHAALIAEILGLLAGNKSAPPSAGPRLPLEPLSRSEIRVLRYLPTQLSAPEIAAGRPSPWAGR